MCRPWLIRSRSRSWPCILWPCYLFVPRTRTTRLGRRSFFVAAPVVWNSLPLHLRSPSISRSQFWTRLKTPLFRLAFHWLFLWEPLKRLIWTYMPAWHSLMTITVVGCMDDVRLNGHWLPMNQSQDSESEAAVVSSRSQNTHDGCESDACLAILCEPGLICHDVWRHAVCRLANGFTSLGFTSRFLFVWSNQLRYFLCLCIIVEYLDKRHAQIIEIG